MGSDIFISYKAEDFSEANYMKTIFEKNGLSCWMAPMSIAGGASYASEIPNAIRNAKVFVLILSRKAQESKWVPKEIDQAINSGKTILPFMIEDCGLNDDFNFYLTNIQRYEAYVNKQAAINKILMDIRSIINNDKTCTDNGEDVSPKEFFAESPVLHDAKPEKQRKKNFFSRITPYGYKGSRNPILKVPMIMSDIYAVIALLSNLIIFLVGGVGSGALGWFSAIAMIICSTLAVWHLAYAAGLLWNKMPKFLAFLVQIILVFIAFFIITIAGIMVIVS